MIDQLEYFIPEHSQKTKNFGYQKHCEFVSWLNERPSEAHDEQIIEKISLY
jgi:hypothetical protein